MNCKGPYRGTSSQHLSMLRYYVCAIKSHARNKEQVCWNSCWRGLLNYNSREKIKNQRSSRSEYAFSVIPYIIYLSRLKNISKKEKISLYLVYNIVSLGKMAGKADELSWRWTWRQIFRKFSCCENLWLFWMMLNTAFAHL